ncbi:MAG: D-alanyl-D-alanine carboxypeptidase, partial [Muribaculaceae bacterium]|nr:D-alanyl-D-alanine carboxypeptidase [Muribaculaceae bacterium]
SMPDPGAVLANRLEAVLTSRGIKVEHGAVSSAGASPVALLRYESPKLAEVGRSLMVRSDNLMAEATLRAIAPSLPLDSAIVREAKLWRTKGVDPGYWRINDGSGLSRFNAISAATLGAVLRAMALDSSLAAAYIDSFARVGLDGTLTSFLAKHPRKGEFVLKSGSMGGVQCYAGYRLDPNTRAATHVIVVMVNNLVGSRAEFRRAVEQLLLSI